MFLRHSHRFRPKCLCVVEPRVKHRNPKHGWRSDFTRQVLYGHRQATKVSPVSFKSPQKDNIPLHGRRWNATEEHSAVEVRAQLPLLPDGARAQNRNIFFKRTTISELKSLRNVEVFQGMYNQLFTVHRCFHHHDARQKTHTHKCRM